MSEIHSNQSINYLLMEDKKQEVINQKYQEALIDYSQTIDGIYENLKDYNPTKKRRVLIVFDDVIAHMKSNKKLSPIVTELFLRQKRSIFHLFLCHSLISKCLKL